MRAHAQNVPYVFVPSKAALGRACGVSRPVSRRTPAAREKARAHAGAKRRVDVTCACACVLCRARAGDRGVGDDQRGQPAQDADSVAQGERRGRAESPSAMLQQSVGEVGAQEQVVHQEGKRALPAHWNATRAQDAIEKLLI